MAGNGYFDTQAGIYRPKSSETWASYSTWDGFTNWDGTPDVSSPLQFTTQVFDAGDSNATAVMVQYQAANPVTTQISYGNTLSSGSIVSPTTTTIYPNNSNVPLLDGRYFQITAFQDQDSGSLHYPIFQSIDVTIQSASFTDLKSDGFSNKDTSTLSGSVGQRTVSITNIGKAVKVLVQIHSTGLTGTQTPVCYVDKSGTDPVLNIFDADAFGKRTRMDVTADIIIEYMTKLESDEFGNITEST